MRRPLRRETISGIGKFVVDDGVEWKIFLFEKVVERFGLGECAGKAVEEKAAVAAETAGAFADHVPNGGVWDECATTHEVERGGHGTARAGNRCGMRRAENVAGGEMAGTEVLVEELRLRAFADAGSAEEDETPARLRMLGGMRSALGGRALEPGGAIRLLGIHGETFGAAKVFG